MGESKSILQVWGIASLQSILQTTGALSMIPNASKRTKREELQKAHRFSGLQPLGWTSNISIWE